jgi:hypothetical protein
MKIESVYKDSLLGFVLFNFEIEDEGVLIRGHRIILQKIYNLQYLILNRTGDPASILHSKVS